MDFEKVLTQLRQELENLDSAIECLERLNRGAPRRGRPPAWLVPAKRPGVKPNHKPATERKNSSAKKPE
jgi:hypothetical protein